MEENTPGQPQAGDPAQIQPQPQAGNTPLPEPQAGDGKPPLNTADYERMIAELRKESASHRTKLKKFEDEEKARTDAQLTEQQKKDKQLAELQKAHDDNLRSHQEYKISTEVRLQAAALGVNPKHLEKVVRLIDFSEIEYEADGTPKNIKFLLEALTKDWPELIPKSAPTVPTAGGATAPARSATSGPQTITKEYVAQVQRGGPQAWAALSQDEQIRISAFIRGGGLFRR